MGESLSDDEMEKVMAEYGRVQDAIEASNGWDLDRTLETAMDALRCPPPDADVTKISGGERRRVALCRVLLEKPDLLLLDEPTNHLDAESVAWLEQHLAEYPGTSSPSRTTATSSTTSPSGSSSWTAAPASRGRGTTPPGSSRRRPASRQEEKAESTKQKTLERELEWVRMAPRARHAKGKARLQAYEQLLADSGADSRGETNEIYIPAGPRLGDVVVRSESLKKAYGDNLLFDDLSFDLPKGGIVGVIGPNGAGKTTLFKMIMGLETPDGGVLKVGETVFPSYVDQNRDRPDKTKSVWEEISGGEEKIMVGRREMSSRAWCSMFNFKGADQQKRIGDLSGGEMNRLHLARTVKKGATSSSSTSRRTTSTSTRSARSRRRSSRSPAVPSSSRTTAGSSTASRPTCSPSRGTRRPSGSRGTTRSTRPTGTSASAPPPTCRTGSSTGS